MNVHNRRCLKDRRKSLRNRTTSAEAVLWRSLKNSQLDGRKFRRQHSIGRYVVDFYCPSEKLIVELDGEPHFSLEGTIRDQERDLYLGDLGITVYGSKILSCLNNLINCCQILGHTLRMAESDRLIQPCTWPVGECSTTPRLIALSNAGVPLLAIYWNHSISDTAQGGETVTCITYDHEEVAAVKNVVRRTL